MSTHTTKNAQIPVNSTEEALAWYKAANFIDSKISAYPIREEWANQLSALAQAPDLLFLDLDLEHFKSKLTLDNVLRRTLENIRVRLHDDSLQPTVVWSGNGYHIYLPVKAFALESESLFADLVGNNQCSRKFLQFAEQFLSEKKADMYHTKGLSFKNCMLRVPGSINSKNGETVRVVRKWNGVRPAINWLLRDYRRYLIQCVYVDSRRRQTKRVNEWLRYWRTK